MESFSSRNDFKEILKVYLLTISNKTPEEKIGCKSASHKQLRIVFIWAVHRLALQPQKKGQIWPGLFFKYAVKTLPAVELEVFESNSDNLRYQQLHQKYMCPGALSLQMFCSRFELKM